MVLALHQVVLRAVYGAEAVGQQRVGNLVRSGAHERCARDIVALGVFLGGVVLSDFDLFQNEPHVTGIEREALTGRRRGNRRRQDSRDNPHTEQESEGTGRELARDTWCLPSDLGVADPPSGLAMFRHDVYLHRVIPAPP